MCGFKRRPCVELTEVTGLARRRLVPWCILATLAAGFFSGTGCGGGPDLNAEWLISGMSRLILQPDDSCADLRDRYHLGYLPLADDPSGAGMAYEEAWVPVDAYTALRTWYMPTELDRGTVIFSHGNAGTMACYLFTAQLLTSYGWSVVMYEYEGYGLSGGTPSLETLRPDLEAVMDWTLERTGRQQVSLFGMSLGSLPTVAVAVDRPEAVNAVILDSPVAMGAEVRRFVAKIGLADWVIGQLSPDLLTDIEIESMYQPLLIFMHEQDYVTTPGSVELLYARAPGTKQLVNFMELGHARGQFFSTDIYLHYMENFLTGVWSTLAPEPAQ